MCGIAGIVHFDGRRPDKNRLLKMRHFLQHRGPDQTGLSIHGPCALAHARLSIIDLQTGTQPMDIIQKGDANALSLVFNGCIYNHRELRKKLESQGHHFQSNHSDAEVILHGYRHWGADIVCRLRGMFAFAIWDHQAKQLFMARDRIGKKPLFLRAHRGHLAFASTIGALLVGVNDSPEINRDALLHFLKLGYTGYQSLCSNVNEILPGHWLRIDSTGKQTQKCYWQPPPRSMSKTTEGLKSTLVELLHDAVNLRLEADVPLGCFLSGGIDSAIVAALAHQQLLKKTGQPLQTFSVKMPVAAYDESDAAQVVAKMLGTKHTELVAEPSQNIFDDLKYLISVYGEPTADSSILPTYWLSRVAQQKVKVALSGDGGDELFGGYDRYRAIRLIHSHRAWLSPFSHRYFKNSNPKSARTRFGRLVHAAESKDPAEQYLSMIHLFDAASLQAFGFDQTDWQLADWPNHDDSVYAAMHWDLTHYLPMDILRKVDRASMAVGLEVRCPLLDYRVCELASHVPPALLMPAHRPKGLLRDIAAQLLSPKVAKRPKRGFAIPIGQWFRHELKDQLADHLLGGQLDSIGITKNLIENIYQEHQAKQVDHTHRLFALLELSLWLDWLKSPALSP